MNPTPDSPPHSAAETPAPLERAPLAYQNEDFLDSPDGRGLRILAEYQEPLVRFQRERIADTCVFFGSARFRPAPASTTPAPTQQPAPVVLLENTGSAAPAPPHEQDRFTTQPAAAAQPAETHPLPAAATPTAATEMAHFYEEARTLARMVATWSKALPGPRHRFVVTSGGGPGIMEAANRGAWEAGAKTIGLNIKLPFEQVPNRYITPELNFEFRYFFMRKYWFAYLAKALVVFPGGFGTMDEMFEILTLAQTRKLTKALTVVLYGTSYWKSVLNLDLLAERGAIAPKDLKLFQFADTPQAAFELLRAGLTHHVHHHDPHEAHEDAPPPAHPAPTAQALLGPDINKTQP